MSQSNYGLSEIIKNVVYVIRTRIIVPHARMIRFPIIIRGKKYIDFGTNLTTGARCRIEVHGNHHEKKIIFGKNVNMGYDVRMTCSSKIVIGDNVLIGSRVLIIDNSHGKYSGHQQDIPSTPPNERKIVTAPLEIADNVWIGENVVIQMGVKVGYGSIIAANSVVTKDIPEKSIVAGAPAKVIKIYNDKNKEWEKIQ